jgi:hypothetical protein
MKGKISKIWINELDDGRTYASLSINGERYTLWNKKYIEELQKGDEVEYDCKQSGKYKNITNIAKVQSGPVVDSNNNGSDNGFNNGLNNGIDHGLKKAREIVRMSCIKSAIYLTKDFGGMDLDDRAESVVEVARKFERYVTEVEDLGSLQEGNGRKDLEGK